MLPITDEAMRWRCILMSRRTVKASLVRPNVCERFRPPLWCRSASRAECRPIRHERATLFHPIAPPVRRFHLIADDVREGGLGDLAGVIGLLRCPVAESGSEAVRHEIWPHAAEKLEERHIRQGAARSAAREQEFTIQLARQLLEDFDCPVG
jgi:hypothetical protein